MIVDRNHLRIALVSLVISAGGRHVKGADDAEIDVKPLVLYCSDRKHVPSVFAGTPPPPAVPTRKLHAIVTSVKVVANSPSFNSDNDRAEFATKSGPNDKIAGGRARRLILWFDSNRMGYAPAVHEEWTFEFTDKGEFHSMSKVPRPAQ